MQKEKSKTIENKDLTTVWQLSGVMKKQLDCVSERFKESEEDDETTCVVLDECK